MTTSRSTRDRDRNNPRARARIGTSGYDYDDWRGILYPEDLGSRDRFSRYQEAFDTVEINNTFYHLPDDSTVDGWRDAARGDFLYALKYSRYGTHMKKLLDPADHLRPFLDRAARLGDRLGPILVQLPPHWKADPGRLGAFLDAALDLQEDRGGRRRWAIELRDPRWLDDAVYRTLSDRGAALVIHDMIEDHPRIHTADWTYLRFHGPRATRKDARYQGGYPYQFLTAEARRIERELADGLDVFVYFNNDQGGHAVEDAQRLARYLGQGPDADPS